MNINNYKGIITKLAWKYFLKTRRPSTFEITDFIQEGFIIFLECCKTFNQEKSKFSTYLYFCLSNHFKNLITVNNRYCPIPKDFDKIITPDEELQPCFYPALSEKASEFVLASLNPDAELSKKLSGNRSKKDRTIVSEYLGLTWYETEKIKQECLRKLVR